jgi:chemotaxis protein MotB
MAMGRGRRRSAEYGEFWPGYVDVLSTLLLVVTFLMSVFMIAQFFATQESAGKDTVLQRLNRQLSELTSLLSLEKGKAKESEDQVAELQAMLATLKSDNEKLSGVAKSACCLRNWMPRRPCRPRRWRRLIFSISNSHNCDGRLRL